MSAVRKNLEHWTEFINPYKRVRNSIDHLISEIDSLKLDFTNDPIPDMVEFTDFKEMEESWQERSKKYRSALGLSFGVRAMLPVMAESFVNLLLYYLMKPELKADIRLKENIIRQQFDIRVKSLSHNCFGFANAVDYSNEICGRFHSLVNERNDLLHGNFTIEKLKFNEIYFTGRVPIFKEYSTMWERAFGIEQKFSGLETLNDELKTTDNFIAYLKSCLSSEYRDAVEIISDQIQLGLNSENGRLGVLFSKRLVDMAQGPKMC